ncbi:hypothetical protein KUTeg_022280 [Tegillarca granosa]|uniref:Integumentary mucin C.1-like n=1 Tax=Tegillarca granosa TaxID=220873 RepID=A0ABQ9EAB8_TEGGR|nr:hypothetical protein KUTeg_022280 [Tegillarca granosa]
MITAAPTTMKPTTAAPTTMKPTTAAPTTMKPTTVPTTRKPTTVPTTQTTTTTKKQTTSAPTTTTAKLKFTTSHKVVKVTNVVTPTPKSHDNINQPGNGIKKTTEHSPVVPSSKNSESAKKENDIDIKNDFFIAGLARNPISQCPPVFSLSQTLVSIFIMIISVVLLR